MKDADLDGVLRLGRYGRGKPQGKPRRGGKPAAGIRSLRDRTDRFEH
jgi:hypothetical protein